MRTQTMCPDVSLVIGCRRVNISTNSVNNNNNSAALVDLLGSVEVVEDLLGKKRCCYVTPDRIGAVVAFVLASFPAHEQLSCYGTEQANRFLAG